MQIRELQPSELIQAVPLMAKFHAEVIAEHFGPGQSPGDGRTFDAAFFQTHLTRCLAAGVGVVIGAWEEQQLVGFLFGAVVPDPTMCCLVASESHWFIDKAHRSAGLPMLTAFTAWGQARGARVLTVGHFPYANGQKLGRLYRTLGFEHFQEQYIKELPPCV